MRTTTLKNIALSAMLVGSIGLTSCDKNDDPKPTPNEVQQHLPLCIMWTKVLTSARSVI